jgi:DNA invertase Pin-like site-specific DNA recombinase
MLEDVKQDKIDLILMTKLDRWFRNIGDFYKVIEIIKAHKTDWKTIWEDYDTTTASGEFWLNMSLSMGQLEAKRTSERINEVFNYKFNIQKTICSGSIPFGYSINEEKKLIIDESKKNIVKELYDYYNKTNNLSETTRWFCNKYWNISLNTIKKYLSNPIYIGKYRRFKTKEIIEDFAPPIINEELFYKVQNQLDKNIKNNQQRPNSNRHNIEPYIFSGLLFCKECGGRLSGKTNTGHTHYYNCRKHEKKLCANKKCVREKIIEEYLIKNIYGILENRKIKIKEINDKKEEFIDNTSTLKSKLNKLTSLYLEDLIDKDYYKEQYNEISFQIQQISKKKVNNKKIDYSHIDKLLKSNFLDIYSSLNNLEKRTLWASIIDRIELTDINDLKIVVY